MPLLQAIAGAVLVLAAGASVTAARAQPPTCQYGLSQAPLRPHFGRFPATARPGPPAAVHLRTGLDRSYRTMLEMDAAAGPSTDDMLPLRFRLDSRLLVVLGAPGEDATRDGVAYYEWTGHALGVCGFSP